MVTKTETAPAAGAGKPQAQHFLQRVQLFSLLSTDECDAIVRRLKRRDFPPSHYVVREGAAGDSMFFITAGKCEVRKKDVGTGIEFLLTELGPGACFGEMALLTGQPRTASVVSTEPTTVGILKNDDFRALLLEHPKIGVALTTILAERLQQASEQVGIEYMNLARLQLDPRVLGLVPEQAILAHKVLPVAFVNNRLTLAMVNPDNIIALDDVRRFVKGAMIEPVVCTAEEPTASATELRSSAEDAPVVRLANAILALAVKRGASDIHMEPREKEMVVRFRIDGVLQVMQTLPKKAQMGLVSRMKILSKLDIAEKRMPQDGRISVRLENRAIDFRVSTIPSKWGEKICMRILDK